MQLFAYLLFAALIFWFELPVWFDEAKRSERLNGWLSGREFLALPWVPFLVLFPLCYFGFRRSRAGERGRAFSRLLAEGPSQENQSLNSAWFWAIFVFITSGSFSLHIGERFSDLPPAYHDEYSYLLQAELFANGNWSIPSFSTAPDLFDQMHVLNEGQFASRYFPGTSLWLAPFFRFGNVWYAQHLAQAISAMMVFWLGREVSNSGTGLLAGLLFATSPGLVLFSQLLLAHHPTLVGLTLFLWSFLRWMRTESRWNAFSAGVGLAFAMLCRPMTAASFGLPFGIIFFVWWLKGRRRNVNREVQRDLCFKQRTIQVVLMGLPILSGFAVLAVQNLQVTGNILKTPYGLYNEIYTPRHVYGFHNRTRGDRPTGPLVSDQYDRWAKDLTLDLAWENVKSRMINSWRWTFGVIPLCLSLFLFLASMRQGNRRWWLILSAIISMHLAHIPYWFSGIMGWHYVFETSLLWLLILSEMTRRLFSAWRESGHWLMPWCWLLFLISGVVFNVVTVEPLWPARLDQGVVELQYPRKLYQSFRNQTDRLREGQPAVVFIIPDQSDTSIDYVTNQPDWNADVLIARVSEKKQIDRYTELFPNRIVLIFDAQTREFEVHRVNSLREEESP